MKEFRMKPVVIHAVQYTGQNRPEIDEALGNNAVWKDGELFILTLEGAMHASVNDWIIKGAQGEFYACKPDIFVQTYEAV